MAECIFCKIIKGELPSSKIYENDNFVAFLDIQPVNKGHVLIVPKEHYPNLIETPDNLVSELLVLSKKIASAIKVGLRAEGINFVINNGEAAGQVIFHTHLHIIPRFKNDGHRSWECTKYDNDIDRETVVEKIINQLK